MDTGWPPGFDDDNTFSPPQAAPVQVFEKSALVVDELQGGGEEMDLIKDSPVDGKALVRGGQEPPTPVDTFRMEPAASDAAHNLFSPVDTTTEQELDWMNAGIEQPSAAHEPVTGVGALSAEPLLFGDGDNDVLLGQSTPALDISEEQRLSTGEEGTTILAHTEPFAHDEQGPFASIGAEPVEIVEASAMDLAPFGLGPGGDIMPHTTSHHVPFFETHQEESGDGTRELGISGGDNTTSNSASPFVEQRSTVDDWLGEATKDNDMEDSWAKAFGSPDNVLDDSWEAAFGEGLDDEDGFLNDNSPNTSFVPPTSVASAQFSRPFEPTATMSPYTAVSPVRDSGPASQSSRPVQFFADLPTALPVRSRKPPQQAMSQAQPVPPPPMQNRQVPPPQSSGGQDGYAQLRQPERLDPFPPQPSAPIPSLASSILQSPPELPAGSQYSPAAHANLASASFAKPPSPATTKYSPAQSYSIGGSAGIAPPPSNTLYTPSPPQSAGRQSPYAKPPSHSASAPPPRPRAPDAPTQGVASSLDSQYQATPSSRDIPSQMQPPAMVNRFAPRTSSPLAQPDHRPPMERPTAAQPAGRPEPYAPHQYQQIAPPLEPPQRSRTSSPGKSVSSVTEPRIPPIERPSSTQAQRSLHMSPLRDASATGSQAQGESPNFVLPTDESALDPLQRWKGSPIFRWGPGGLVSVCLPKHIPRYGGGQAAPKIKSLTGDVRLRRFKDIFPDDDQLSAFPGPLKNKSKKKEVLSWMNSAIERIQSAVGSSNDRPRAEEKLLLWQVVKLFIENDGVMKGKPAVDAAVRQLITVPIDNEPRAKGDSISNSHPLTTNLDQTARSVVIDELKEIMLNGEREKAVWHAVDNRLWAHALLIASTANPDVWKQAVQEFVRKDVQGARHDNHSLATLYQVFAGNWEESIDELVPVSARSGFQMVSTADAPSHTGDGFQGLNRWRETLRLILGNRSNDDENAIIALGKLLAGYGRVEAAHTCFVLAHSSVQFGGADDAQTQMSILGADRGHQIPDSSLDLDSILLSEVYEFGLLLSSSSSSYYVPHLQAPKLHHAYVLAEKGQRGEALQYCDAIAAAMKSQTRVSPYYHATLASQLDDLQRRLSQTSKDESSSWMSRPSIGRVGTWFNNFVAGDDTDIASSGSGTHLSENDAGPFARVPGGTPTISRSPSNVDLYGQAQAAASQFGSRYAPASYNPTSLPDSFSPYGSPERKNPTYSPRQSHESLQYYGGSSHYVRQAPQLSHFHSYQPQPRPDSSSSRSQMSTSYEPYVPTVEEEPKTAFPVGEPLQARNILGAGQYDNTPSLDPSLNGYAATANGLGPSSIDNMLSLSGSESPSYGLEPQGGGYAPSSGGYSPPSYQPYAPATPGDDDSSPVASRRTIMDDDADDDFDSRAEALKKQEKARRDKEADELVRRAAEEDSARDKAEKAKRSSSWLGGWFGKKDPNAPVVHKAKLGEESSFYFDPETKKWVNRKGGTPPASSAAPTPPPPRALAPPPSAPPPRSASAALAPSVSTPPPVGDGPPKNALPGGASGPPSRADTPASSGDPLPEATPTLLAPPNMSPALSASGPPSGPPSRPTTSMSNASSIDDLLGAPQAKKGGTVKKGKKGQRYIDVMAQ